jgi:hypothetical protein
MQLKSGSLADNARRSSRLCLSFISAAVLTSCHWLIPFESSVVAPDASLDAPGVDSRSNTDINPLVDSAAGERLDAGSADDVADAAAGSDPFEFRGLDVLWAGPHTIVWYFRCTGSRPASFRRYELVYGPDEQAVADGLASRLVPRDSIRLGTFSCVDERAGQIVITYDLQPETIYYAQLRLVEGNAGERILVYESPPYVAIPSVETALEGARAELIFGDELPSGYLLEGLEIAIDLPAGGSGALRTDYGPEESLESLSIGGFELAVEGMTEAELEEHAYLEFYLDVRNPMALELLLETDANGERRVIARHALPVGFVAPDSRRGYQRIQVPLALFFAGEPFPTPVPVSLSELRQVTRLTLRKFFQAGSGRIEPLPFDRTVRIDEIRIRY